MDVVLRGGDGSDGVDLSAQDPSRSIPKGAIVLWWACIDQGVALRTGP